MSFGPSDFLRLFGRVAEPLAQGLDNMGMGLPFGGASSKAVHPQIRQQRNAADKVIKAIQNGEADKVARLMPSVAPVEGSRVLLAAVEHAQASQDYAPLSNVLSEFLARNKNLDGTYNYDGYQAAAQDIIRTDPTLIEMFDRFEQTSDAIFKEAMDASDASDSLTLRG